MKTAGRNRNVHWFVVFANRSMTMLKVVAGAAALGLAVLASSQPAAAQAARFDQGLQNAAALPVTNVQMDGNSLILRGGRTVQGRTGLQGNGGGGGLRQGNGGGPRFDGGGRGRRFGNDGGYRRRGNGFGVGAGVVGGLAAGALLGGAIASQGGPGYGYGYDGGYDPGYGYAPPPPAVEDYADAGVSDDPGYCARRYKSYDPSSGTYLGYDGLRHPCP